MMCVVSKEKFDRVSRLLKVGFVATSSLVLALIIKPQESHAARIYNPDFDVPYKTNEDFFLINMGNHGDKINYQKIFANRALQATGVADLTDQGAVWFVNNRTDVKFLKDHVDDVINVGKYAMGNLTFIIDRDVTLNDGIWKYEQNREEKSAVATFSIGDNHRDAKLTTNGEAMLGYLIFDTKNSEFCIDASRSAFDINVSNDINYDIIIMDTTEDQGVLRFKGQNLHDVRYRGYLNNLYRLVFQDSNPDKQLSLGHIDGVKSTHIEISNAKIKLKSPDVDYIHLGHHGMVTIEGDCKSKIFAQQAQQNPRGVLERYLDIAGGGVGIVELVGLGAVRDIGTEQAPVDTVILRYTRDNDKRTLTGNIHANNLQVYYGDNRLQHRDNMNPAEYFNIINGQVHIKSAIPAAKQEDGLDKLINDFAIIFSLLDNNNQEQVIIRDEDDKDEVLRVTKKAQQLLRKQQEQEAEMLDNQHTQDLARNLEKALGIWQELKKEVQNNAKLLQEWETLNSQLSQNNINSFENAICILTDFIQENQTDLKQDQQINKFPQNKPQFPTKDPSLGNNISTQEAVKIFEDSLESSGIVLNESAIESKKSEIKNAFYNGYSAASLVFSSEIQDSLESQAKSYEALRSSNDIKNANALKTIEQKREILKIAQDLYNAASRQVLQDIVISATEVGVHQITASITNTISSPVMQINNNRMIGVSSGSGLEKFGIWGQGFASFAEQKQNTNNDAYRATGFGGSVGFDIGGDTGVVGASYSFAASRLIFEATNEKENKALNHILTIYGAYSLNPNIQFSGQFGGGISNLELINGKKKNGTFFFCNIEGKYYFSVTQNIKIVPKIGFEGIKSNYGDKQNKSSDVDVNRGIIFGGIGIKTETVSNDLVISPEFSLVGEFMIHGNKELSYNMQNPVKVLAKELGKSTTTEKLALVVNGAINVTKSGSISATLGGNCRMYKDFKSMGGFLKLSLCF